MRKKLKINSQIESYLKKPIELLESIGETEDANLLKAIQAKNTKMIFDYMRAQNLPEIKFQHSQSFSITYSLTKGEKDEK
ncbi:MAG: hypothetical protein Q8M39_05205 [Sulfuricurvum sp.]|nr:hypothetical protein [Sulfuricurvum sp.]